VTGDPPRKLCSGEGLGKQKTAYLPRSGLSRSESTRQVAAGTSVGDLTVSDKSKQQTESTRQQIAEHLGQLSDWPHDMIPKAVRDGDSFDKTERDVG